MRPLRAEDPREVGGYRLEARVGEGGMGTVYLTRSRGRHPLALKVIRREYAEDPDFRSRFAREVRAARRVAGPHVVPVVDFDTDAAQPWQASTFVPGVPLDAASAAHGPLPLPAALAVTAGAARALHAVHTAGIVHRDVKPSNVLLGRDGPWVIDFGIARAADASRITVTGVLVGTPRFMSPEHALGRELTPAADVFSLGLVLAVVAGGRHPYGEAGGLAVASLIAATAERPPDLSGHPAPLRGILAAALDADPARRPSAAELAERCAAASGLRDVRDAGTWLPAPLRERVAAAEREVAEVMAATDAAGAVPAPPPVPPSSSPPSGFGPAPAPFPAPPSPSHPPLPATGTTGPAAPARRGRGSVVAAAALTAALVTGGILWAGQSAAPGGTTGGTTGGKGSPSPSVGTSPLAGPTPAGYRLLFERKPFTFSPPKDDRHWVQLDLDMPRATTVGTDVSLPNFNEMTYMEEGILFTHGMWVVDDIPRPAVCDQAQETTAVPESLSPGELRSATLLRGGEMLCGHTSNDHLAQIELTDVVTSPVSDRPPVYKGTVTLWRLPDA